MKQQPHPCSPPHPHPHPHTHTQPHAHLPPHPRSTLLSTRCGSPRVGTAALPRCGDRGRMCRCGWRAPVRQWGCRGWCDSGDRSPQGWGAHVGRFHLGGRHWITVSSIPDSAAGLGVLCMTYTRRTLARRTCMMYLVSVSTVYCTPLRGGLDENLPLTPYTYRCALSPKLSWTYLLCGHLCERLCAQCFFMLVFRQARSASRAPPWHECQQSAASRFVQRSDANF